MYQNHSDQLRPEVHSLNPERALDGTRFENGNGFDLHKSELNPVNPDLFAAQREITNIMLQTELQPQQMLNKFGSLIVGLRQNAVKDGYIPVSTA